MEETEIKEETAPEESAAKNEEEKNEGAEPMPDMENVNEERADAAEENAEISAESFAKTLANPMFAVFARGRSGGIEEAVRDFEKMLSAGKEGISEEMLLKMTPGAFECAGDVALSERQRKIARQAGMSYREYYEIIRSIPTKTK
ncbi:MAG: hypothetical protein IJX27_03855 [Clostridia bacterium]|nr:hypothetical protein [Clostridia bacterium]